MRNQRLPFAILFFLALESLPVFSQSRALTGRVTDVDSRERLPYASVLVKGTKNGAQANVEGFFLLHNIPDTAFVLQIAYLGYSTLEQTIDPADETSGVLFRLKQAPISMEGVTVSASTSTMIKAETVPSMTTVSPIQILSLPSIGQADIFRSLQLLPGISGTNDGSSGLYVRGGTPDQNLVLYDGMTVYHVDHFFGFFSAFNPDALKDVQIYKGAFPAKFGGRLSSVIDLVGKSGSTEETHGEIGASLMSVDGSLQMPLWGASLFVAGRRSFSDIISGGIYDKLYKFLTGSDAPQGAGSTRGGRGFGQGVAQQQTPTSAFSDINLKLTYALTPRYLLSASYYGSADNYDLTRQASTQNFGGFGGGFRIPGQTNNTQQGNNGASVKLFSQWRDDFYSTFVVAYDGYNSSFSANNESRNPAMPQISTSENNTIKDVSVRLDNSWKIVPTHEIGFGLDISNTKVDYSLTGPVRLSGTGTILSMNQQGTLSAGYVQDEWHATEQLTLTGGVRLNHESLTESWEVEPRLSARYAITDEFSLKSAFGIHHQYVNRIVNENVTQGSRDFWILADKSLPLSGASHYVVGGTWESEDYVLDVEGFYKNLDHIVEFTQRFRRQPLDLYAFLSGEGRVKGIEVLLQKKIGLVNGWISYTLSKSEKKYAEYNNGSYFPSENDQTHEVKLVGTVTLGAGWTAAATLIYATGKPYTAPVSQYSVVLLDSTSYSYTHVSGKNAYRLPDYQRFDLSVSKKFTFDASALETGCSLFNVLNHTNISYYEYDLQAQPVIVTQVTGLGFLPSVYVRYEF